MPALPLPQLIGRRFIVAAAIRGRTTAATLMLTGICALPGLGQANSYCTSGLNTACLSNTISRLQITGSAQATLDNSSGCGNGYSLYAPTTPNLTATLVPGQTYQLTVHYSGGANRFAAWIDYNGNGTFDASDFLALPDYSTNVRDTYSFTVPAGAVAGATRLRARTTLASLPALGAGDACAAIYNYSYGETEDYTVTISGVTAAAAAQLAAQVALFPNPAQQTVTLRLPTSLRREASGAVLYNHVGQAVARYPLAGLSRDDAAAGLELPLGSLATGVYALHVRTSAGTIVKRLVVR